MFNSSFSSLASTQSATRIARRFVQLRKDGVSSFLGLHYQHPFENVVLAVLGAALGAYITARPCRRQ